MKMCLDVHYDTGRAAAAALVFEHWTDATPVAGFATVMPASADYEPGMFYRREMEPLLALLGQIRQPYDTIVIDGYCQLSADGAPGLGAHLRKALERDVRIVGIAKNRFRDSRHATELRRGGSIRPLFVTSIGMPQVEAADRVAKMAGDHRFPSLLKAVDRLARNTIAAA